QSYFYFMNLSREEIFTRLDLSYETKSIVDKEILMNIDFSDYDHILCVHSKRGDILTTGLQSPSNASFLLKATNFVYLRQEANSKLVLLIGDDLDWQKDIATTLTSQGKNVVVLPRLNSTTSSVADLHISRKFCDTVLLTASASTIGWWMAYLSKGQNVYYNYQPSTDPLYTKEFESTQFFPSSWMPLKSSEL
ncbi:hypothetical protein PENTCL1PPCAC_29823, partial [Pristionchus entomophagus]